MRINKLMAILLTTMTLAAQNTMHQQALAQYNAADEAYSGEQNFEQARELYQIFLNNPQSIHFPRESAQAQNLLAEMFYYGQGGNIDYIKAEHFYRLFLKSPEAPHSERDFTMARFNLAEIIYKRQKSRADLHEARVLYLSFIRRASGMNGMDLQEDLFTARKRIAEINKLLPEISVAAPAA